MWHKMGDNITASTSSSVASLHQKKTKYRYDKGHLPTPPPDPTKETPSKQEQTEKEKENDFLNYLDSLQKANQYPALVRSASIFSPAIATEDAFDHLERLYKLMDQMLALREQNAKLHRRVRDLEHFSNLQKLQTKPDSNVLNEDILELDKDAAFADSIFESILAEARRDARHRGQVPSKFRQSILRKQRNRSSSINIDCNSHLDSERSSAYKPSRRTSEIPQGDQLKTSKVSKWTKVKAAFKWEKASTTVGSAKSHDSGLGGMLPVNLEVARYLRVPSTSDEVGLSPSDSGAAEISTPGSLSNASSADDLQKADTKNLSDELHSSDDEHQYFSNEYIPHNKDEQFDNARATCSKARRTPWSRMKDIIQTRNSFKKKHRLSARSDDTKPDETTYSESEDVFEDEITGDFVLPVPQLDHDTEIPREVIERYQQVVAEEENASSNKGSPRRVSRWGRVKKAFLTAPDSKGSCGHKSEDFSKRAQEEIDRNYKELQQKLSQEFQEKLLEWERNKATTSSNSAPICTDEPQDPSFLKKMEEWQRIKAQPTSKPHQSLQLQSEENLPPEFRKKLQEWERIKKSSAKEDNVRKKLGERPKWRSVNRGDEQKIEYPQLSEEFLKKLQEWKQIKASGGPSTIEDSESRKSTKDNKTPSPRMIRKLSPSKQKKVKDVREKELQWFEKELNKIEKEKQRLERERQKFLDREERLTKLRRSIMGSNKKEVLVHTRSGFHRFEGISRKFTQKLYEWEKAQGIAPEESTFALLTSCYAPEIRPATSQAHYQTTSGTLLRSKSADSIVTSALNLTCPLISHQPSSLSLNDVENLEKECLVDSKTSSAEYIARVEEMIDDEEPEALIVEVEDIVEETAAPLVENYLIKQQTPVYQHESIKSMCAGEACLAPKVRRSESARAQTNYNLIEESIALLRQIGETEDEIQRFEEATQTAATYKKRNDLHEKQKISFARLCDKLTRLQEANTKVTSGIVNEEGGNTTQRLVEVIDAVQDLSVELLHMADKLDGEVSARNVDDATSIEQSINIQGEVRQINAKILELRRLLSYICAASDMTAPGRKKLLGKRGILKKQATRDGTSPEINKESTYTSIKEEGSYIKSGNPSPSQGAVKKRIRHRQKSLQTLMPDESDDEDDQISNKTNAERKINKHKKLTRTRSRDDENLIVHNEHTVKSTNEDVVVVDPNVTEKLVVPTETNFVSAPLDLPKPPDSPVTVFVKTTRKLFTPIIEKKASHGKPGLSKSVSLPTAQAQHEQLSQPSKEEGDPPTQPEINITVLQEKETPVRLPPLPGSPTPQRKILKDNMSPNIRIMLARYNQKISEQDVNGPRSAGSSGSNSPIAWRSPTFERRVKAQTEKYQEEVKKHSPLLGGRHEVQKSASVGIMHCCMKQVTKPTKDTVNTFETNVNSMGIAKSCSARDISMVQITETIETDTHRERKSASLKLSINRSPLICLPNRTQKLQKAKEDFLNSGSISAPIPTRKCEEKGLKFPSRNRLSQISVESESSFDSTSFEGVLIKSASAGMINIDADTYRKIDPEIHREGYVSLPRNCKKGKEGFLESIASKFRKIKMRKGRDKNRNAKMNAVSALCRQSLVVDINKSPDESSNHQSTSKLESNQES